uniref:Retrotransposon gag domain-containing protein n=1 Tax=Aegilops tauschii subsp. strangulata TaxID=200361 RepID=A0A453QQD3_AEGTS
MNYTKSALIMRVRQQAQGLLEVVEHGAVIDYHDDREALGIILQAVPPEMLRSLAAKDSAKEAWDALKTLRMGSERVCEDRAQTHRLDFENLQFKDEERMEEFALRLTSIVNDLEALGDGITERKVVRKFLCCVP